MSKNTYKISFTYPKLSKTLEIQQCDGLTNGWTDQRTDRQSDLKIRVHVTKKPSFKDSWMHLKIGNHSEKETPH